MIPKGNFTTPVYILVSHPSQSLRTQICPDSLEIVKDMTTEVL